MSANLTERCFTLIISLSFVLIDKHGNAQSPADGICTTEECKKSAQLLEQNMDLTMDPCFDFYGFACGNFKNHNPIPPGEEKVDSFFLRIQEIYRILLGHLESSTKSTYPGLRAAQAFYSSCMDEDTIEALGGIPIPAELNKAGLPIKPPFNSMATKNNNYSQILARMQKIPHGVFLFKIDTTPDPRDSRKNRLVIGKTPSTKNQISGNVGSPVRRHHRNCYGSYEDRDLEDDEESIADKDYKRMLKEYMVNVVNYMLKFTDAKSSKSTANIISTRADKVTNFLLRVNKISKKTYNLSANTEEFVTISQLQEKTDKILKDSKIKFNWLDFFEELYENICPVTDYFQGGAPIIISNMSQLENVLRLLSIQDEEVLESTLWWLVTRAMIPYSTKELRTLHQKYLQTISDSRTDLSRQSVCVRMVYDSFNPAVAHLLIMESNSSENDKRTIIEMAENVRASFKENIVNCPWLDESTKMAALNKLESIDAFISYENWLMNSKAVQEYYKNAAVLEDSLYLTQMNTYTQFMTNRLKWIDIDNHYEDAIKSPQLNPAVVNAQYNFHVNVIDVPIGILAFPQIGHGLQCMNYGGIGVIIGHELVHGFDNNGSKYDTFGKTGNWWKEATYTEFQTRSKCFVAAYNEFYFEEIKMHVNGAYTLPENIADNGGFRQALNAYRKYVQEHGPELKLPNFEHLSSEQLFTLALASVWCENSKPSYIESLIKQDVHAPNSTRVNGMVMNSKDFADIWQCDEDSRMNPSNKCLIW